MPEPDPAICPPIGTIMAEVFLSEEYSDKLRETGHSEYHICGTLEKMILDNEPRLKCVESQRYSNFVLVMECPIEAFPEAIDHARGILSEAVPGLIEKLSAGKRPAMRG